MKTIPSLGILHQRLHHLIVWEQTKKYPVFKHFSFSNSRAWKRITALYGVCCYAVEQNRYGAKQLQQRNLTQQSNSCNVTAGHRNENQLLYKNMNYTTRERIDVATVHRLLTQIFYSVSSLHSVQVKLRVLWHEHDALALFQFSITLMQEHYPTKTIK